MQPVEPCSTAHDYFTAEERRHLEAFFAAQPSTGTIYTNADGEVRTVRQIRLPLGVITSLTVYGRPIHEGSPYNFYHTPLAKITEHREAEVSYQDGEGKWKKVRSSEWLEWVKKGASEAQVPEEPKTLVPTSLIRAQEDAASDFKVIDEQREKETKEDWQPMTTRKKLSRKSSPTR